MSAMIHSKDNKIVVQGSITIDNVVTMTQQGIALFKDNRLSVLDLSKITDVDSAVISMLLEWLREAHKIDLSLQFANIPNSLASLIQLYGIAELIPTDGLSYSKSTQ